ncbi:MAG: hypothetical protein QM666_07200, partial [Acinetobacter sp.]
DVVLDSGETIQHALKFKDLTQDFVLTSDLYTDLAQLSELPTREYSIASIPEQRQLNLVVRQQQNEQGELGLGSGWLTQHCAIHSDVLLSLRTNENFHLIEDDRPIICIGNGTGIAGLLSLLHTRQLRQHHRNWLIWGERHRQTDYFYQTILEEWQNDGMLQRLDVVFSRDQAEKIYVHHVLRQQATLFKQWIADDAVIYVCGSLNGMAGDVDAALVEILGVDAVEELRLHGRYRRDVY